MQLTPLLQRAKQIIIKHEDFKTFPYKDTVGHISIGVGYDLTARGLPMSYLNQLCEEDIQYHYDELSKYLWFQILNEPRKMIIIDMAYNLGQKGLLGFTEMIKALSKKDYETAAKEILNSKWATQVGNRAQEAHDVILNGDF